jgi:hypothetical protein
VCYREEMSSPFSEARKRQFGRLGGAKPPTARAAIAIAKSQAYQDAADAPSDAETLGWHSRTGKRSGDLAVEVRCATPLDQDGSNRDAFVEIRAGLSDGARE